MSFSYSTFAVEIDGVPMLVFQAGKHSEAEEICREWTEKNLSDLCAKYAVVYDANSSIKVRLARPAERASYQNATTTDTAASQGVRLVYLANLSS